MFKCNYRGVASLLDMRRRVLSSFPLGRTQKLSENIIVEDRRGYQKGGESTTAGQIFTVREILAERHEYIRSSSNGRNVSSIWHFSLFEITTTQRNSIL